MSKRRVWSCVAWSVLLAVMLTVTGCASLFQKDEAIPPKTMMREVTKTTYPDGRIEELIKEVYATGPGFKGSVAKDLQLGGLEIDFEHTSAGGIKFKGFKMSSLQPLYYVGAAAIILGIVIGYISGSMVLGVVTAAAGGSIILMAFTLETYPWIGLIAGIMILMAIGYVIYLLWKGNAMRKTVEAVVPAVEEMDEDQGHELKKWIESHAKSDKKKVKSEVTKVKQKLGLA